MKQIFEWTYQLLISISKFTGLSYKEINIIVWFYFIPFTWAFLLDKLFRFHKMKIILAIVYGFSLLVISDFRVFSERLFDTSAEFLRGFSGIGISYIQASVIICVILPLIIYALLIFKLLKRSSNP